MEIWQHVAVCMTLLSIPSKQCTLCLQSLWSSVRCPISFSLDTWAYIGWFLLYFWFEGARYIRFARAAWCSPTRWHVVPIQVGIWTGNRHDLERWATRWRPPPPPPRVSLCCCFTSALLFASGVTPNSFRPAGFYPQTYTPVARLTRNTRLFSSARQNGLNKVVSFRMLSFQSHLDYIHVLMWKGCGCKGCFVHFRYIQKTA